MSMGEPFLNYGNVREAIERLNLRYPNAELLVSTIGPMMENNLADFVELSCRINRIGLQLSIHKSDDAERDELIPYANKMSLIQLRDYGIRWWSRTGRKVYCNYCIDDTNNEEADFIRLRSLFSPLAFAFTFSVICPKNHDTPGFNDLDKIREFEARFAYERYNTRVFDPAGQDDIGGGCGQLWYVQDYLKHKA